MKIDFEFKEEKTGFTIFGILFDSCVKYHKTFFWSEKSLKEDKFKNLLCRIESIFDKLTEFAEFDKKPEKMKKILEMTNKSGSALIMFATGYSSMKIRVVKSGARAL